MTRRSSAFKTTVASKSLLARHFGLKKQDALCPHGTFGLSGTTIVMNASMLRELCVGEMNKRCKMIEDKLFSRNSSAEHATRLWSEVSTVEEATELLILPYLLCT